MQRGWSKVNYSVLSAGMKAFLIKTVFEHLQIPFANSPPPIGGKEALNLLIVHTDNSWHRYSGN